MDRGLGSVVVDVEADFGSPSCPLVLSLTTCLQEVDPSSPAAPHIERALTQLGSGPVDAVSTLTRRSSPAALAAYLEYLVPEVATLCPRAAISVRWAADALGEADVGRAGGRTQ